jgi:putative DNA primase/helicase
MPTRNNNALVANVRLGYSMGWSFTPLAGKRPILKGWQKRPRETLEEALAWAVQGNMGLRTGRISGVVIIDVDDGGDAESLGLPPTVTVKTGGNGRHFYFRHEAPLGNSSGRLGLHVDVRADGGQVVFPGSIHPETGRAYEWVPGHSPGQVQVAELPSHIIERLRVVPRPAVATTPPPAVWPRPSGMRRQRYAAKALAREIRAVHQAQEGTRNDTLNKAAFSLGTLVGGGHVDRSFVEKALLEAASVIGLGQSEARATIRSGLGSGLQHPRRL